MRFRDIIDSSINESKNLNMEYILQKLADADINAKFEDDSIVVSKDDIQEAKKLVKKLGCKKSVKSGLNEAIDGINNYGIGYIITYSLFMVAQAHVWHLLCPSGQKHMALGEFYSELSSEVDELAEKFIAQGGVLQDVSQPITVSYDEFEILKAFENFRNYVTGAINTNPEMQSIIDGLVDIQEVIDSKLYKFKLQ